MYFYGIMDTLKKIGLWTGPALMALMLLLPHPEALSPEAWKVLAMAAFMIVWWVTEAVPIPVTSLLPIICLPLLGVGSVKESAAPYSNPVVFLFMGGFMVAIAMEKWNLHRRKRGKEKAGHETQLGGGQPHCVRQVAGDDGVGGTVEIGEEIGGGEDGKDGRARGHCDRKCGMRTAECGT